MCVLGFGVPNASRSPVNDLGTAGKHKVTTSVDLSCLFLNELPESPEALKHGPSFRYQ